MKRKMLVALLLAIVATFMVSTVYAPPPPPAELSMVSPPVTWVYMTDFRELDFSGSVRVTAEVVFVGYGLTMPASFPISYDDYNGIDVTGKIVLVLRHSPNDDATWNIPMPGFGPLTAHMFGYKARNAYMHGAVGMILVNDYNHGPEVVYATLTADGYIKGFGALWAHRTSVGETLLPSLAVRQAQIDSTLTPKYVSTGKTVNMVVRGFDHFIKSQIQQLRDNVAASAVDPTFKSLAGSYLDVALKAMDNAIEAIVVTDTIVANIHLCQARLYIYKFKALISSFMSWPSPRLPQTMALWFNTQAEQIIGNLNLAINSP